MSSDGHAVMTVTPFDRGKRPASLQTESFAAFEGKDIPEIDWLIPGVLVRGGVTLFSGQGGKGKSLLCMQMQAALALGSEWLGIPVKEAMSSFSLYCEDENSILHRRMDDVRQHYRCSFTDLERARFKSRVGFSNELMRFWGRKEEGELTALYRQIADEMEIWGCRVLVVDTVADAFGGNENIRSQVRSFVNALRRIVLPLGGGVVLNAHPSRAGLTDGSGLSGSTAWEASVRTRINLTEPRKPDEDAEGEQEPTRERLLKVMKNNYGPSGTKWKLEWREGVFVRMDVPSGLSSSLVDRLDARRKLMDAARYLVEHGAFLSAEATAKNALPSMARKLTSCREIPWSALRSATDALEAEGKLYVTEMGPPSKRKRYIRPADMLYPGEQQGEPT